MTRNLKWLVGILVVLAIAAHFWTNREVVVNVGNGRVLVVNKWTGNAWLIDRSEWRRVTGKYKNWWDKYPDAPATAVVVPAETESRVFYPDAK